VNRRIVEALHQIRLLASVNEEDLRALVPGAVRHVYRCGNIILELGRRRIVAFVRGSGREYRSSVNGDEVTIATYEPGEIYGLECANLDVQSRSTLMATAEQTEVVVLSPIVVREFLRSHPLVLLAAFDRSVKRGELVTNRLEEVTLYDVTACVAHELARQAEGRDEGRVLATHSEVASWIGASEWEVSKSVRRLNDEGLITGERHRRGIVVLDRRRLAATKGNPAKCFP
jgi:CRP-like cAMP-binding protein